MIFNLRSTSVSIVLIKSVALNFRFYRIVHVNIGNKVIMAVNAIVDMAN